MNRKLLIIAITVGTLSLASGCSIAEQQLFNAVVSDPAPANSVPLTTDPPAPAVIFQQCDVDGSFAPVGECSVPNSVPATEPPAPEVIVEQCDAFGNFAPEGECD